MVYVPRPKIDKVTEDKELGLGKEPQDQGW